MNSDGADPAFGARSFHSHCKVPSMASSSLGFHPPQFSEDGAWVPGWLLQHQESLNEHVQGSHSQSGQALKDLRFQEGSTNQDRSWSLNDEGRYNSCHLILSGIDSLPLTSYSSPRNALHFHLRLSLDDSSENLQSPSLVNEIGRHDAENVIDMEHAEKSNVVGEDSQPKVDHTEALVNSSPPSIYLKSSDNIELQNVNKKRDFGEKFQEKSNTGKTLGDDDISPVVELTIAASEALAIHESVKSGPLSEVLPAANLLEVALRIKEARLERFESPFNCLNEVDDELESLSDLDDSSMRQAFEDVGLSGADHDDLHVSSSLISRVEDTPGSVQPIRWDNTGINAASNFLETNYINASVQNELSADLVVDMVSRNSLALEECSSEVELHNDTCLHLDSNCCSNESLLHLVKGGSHLPLMEAQENLNSHAFTKTSEYSGQENEDIIPVSHKFTSRWLGGWTGKEDGNACIRTDNAKRISEYFFAETSLLSESADIAPDENSYIQEQATRLTSASESSLPSDSITANERVLLSHDLMRSPQLSLSDPLCSIVPCSLMSDNAVLLQPQNQNHSEFHPRKNLSTNLDIEKGNLNIELMCRDSESALKINAQSSGTTVCKRLISLKDYSMPFSGFGEMLKEGITYCQPLSSSEYRLDLLSSGRNHGCSISNIDSPDLIRSKYRCTAHRSSNKIHDIRLSGTVSSDSPNKKRSYAGNAKDGAVVPITAEDVVAVRSHSLVEERCPSDLNLKVNHILEAYRTSPKISLEKDSLQVAASNPVDNRQKKMSEKRIGEKSNPHDVLVPMRKRVRFSEVEVELQQINTLRTLQSAQGKRPIKEPREKFKDPSKAGSKTQTTKLCFKNNLFRDKKWSLFHGLNFLLTGLFVQKEKEIEELIRKYGGTVLNDIPSAPRVCARKLRSSWQQHPIVLCSGKLQTTKFLYGCAVDTLILKVDWLTKSISEGSLLPPENFMILPHQNDGRRARIGHPVRRKHHRCIFERVGIMLHGKQKFCTKIAKVFKHGGGQVFKTLQLLVQSLASKKNSVGAIITENESTTSRHLRKCASERKILMLPANWIINSLHVGKLLPFPENQ